jgi:hypothetical protein
LGLSNHKVLPKIEKVGQSTQRSTQIQGLTRRSSDSGEAGEFEVLNQIRRKCLVVLRGLGRDAVDS